MNRLSKSLFLLFLLIVELQACLRLTRSTDTFIKEQGEGGFDEIVLFNGDTLCVPPHLKHDNIAPMKKGMFIHYHITGDSIRDFFAVEGAGIISPHVHEYVKDSSFMLIDQKPLDSVFGEYIRIYYNDSDYYFRRKYDTIDNYNGTMLMMENSDIHLFWIVGIETADVYGPLDFNQYLKKKEELGIPKDLKLKHEK